MNQYVIILAGGKGLRMGATVPKQFLEIKGKAIILHTLEKFKEALPLAELLLVLPKSEMPLWQEISGGTTFENIKTTSGGDTRFESVKAGLRLIGSEGVVGVHDAVRPFVSIETIQAAFNTAESTGTAVPVVDLKDSIRKVNTDQSVAVNRSNFKIVQTPQCFDVDILKKAYRQEFNTSFTDDASVVEADGIKVSLVMGNYSNIKITTVEDLKVAEALI